MDRPTFSEERSVWSIGCRRVAGVDEAGRGPLAGPVVAAAVVLPLKIRGKWVSQVADSKLLTPAKRESLYDCVRQAALGVGIGVIDARTIDMVGIAPATRLAMKAAVKQLHPPPDYLLIDYFKLPEVKIPQKGVLDGDTLCFSIAAASIIAKVARDRLMADFDREYPGYGFAEHKGYGTRVHIDCLQKLGPSPIHRRSFQPVRDVCGVEI
jgi:ribonuclease HII